MITLKMPTWFDATEISNLKNCCYSFWLLVEQWVTWPLTQNDADTCTESVLHLLAWQRGINRFEDEPLWLYRARTKHAKANAEDAGSVAGMQRIFNRVGIGYVEIIERDPLKDWDVITLRLSDNQVSGNPSLINIIIQMYGRTCRRYEVETISPVSLELRSIELNADYYYDSAIL